VRLVRVGAYYSRETVERPAPFSLRRGAFGQRVGVKWDQPSVEDAVVSAPGQEIYEKFQQLDDEAKQRVLEHLNDETKPFDDAAWFRKIDALREEICAENGKLAFSAAMLVDEKHGEE
jgi:hypothetical protein